MLDLLVVGGGAAGFFAAIQLAEKQPNAKITILEKSKDVLQKVKISGGGRCNVTHAAFVPKELATNYPRGQRELIGPFHHFCTGDMLAWLEENGVSTKTEEDGRIFPTSDSSQTIIDLFLSKSKAYGISILKSTSLVDFELNKDTSKEKTSYLVHTNKETIRTKNLLIATGSSPKVWKLLEKKELPIVRPVPSLFTFHCKENGVTSLAGVSTYVKCQLKHPDLPKIETQGPMLITHWGFSGPAILKLSAWAARELANVNYHFSIAINSLPNFANQEVVFEVLKKIAQQSPKQSLYSRTQFDLPKRWWQKLIELSEISSEKKWVDLPHSSLRRLSEILTKANFKINGKSTFKEEFVTSGGVDLKAIDFKNFSVKKHPNLYIAGECLNIDAVTGGFNFQNAWTGGYLVAQDIAEK